MSAKRHREKFIRFAPGIIRDIDVDGGRCSSRGYCHIAVCHRVINSLCSRSVRRGTDCVVNSQTVRKRLVKSEGQYVFSAVSSFFCLKLKIRIRRKKRREGYISLLFFNDFLVERIRYRTRNTIISIIVGEIRFYMEMFSRFIRTVSKRLHRKCLRLRASRWKCNTAGGGGIIASRFRFSKTGNSNCRSIHRPVIYGQFVCVVSAPSYGEDCIFSFCY